jgi:hypothetical protein
MSRITRPIRVRALEGTVRMLGRVLAACARALHAAGVSPPDIDAMFRGGVRVEHRDAVIERLLVLQVLERPGSRSRAELEVALGDAVGDQRRAGGAGGRERSLHRRRARLGFSMRPVSGRAGVHRRMSACATTRPRNQLTRFWTFRCLKVMDSHRNLRRQPLATPCRPTTAKSVVTLETQLALTNMGTHRTLRRWPSWVFAVRSFAIGNPEGGVFGSLVGNPRRWGAPDSLYLPIPVTFLLCLLRCVQAVREPRSSAHD